MKKSNLPLYTAIALTGIAMLAAPFVSPPAHCAFLLAVPAMGAAAAAAWRAERSTR